MHTAVIEFDSLADPVRPATENHYFVRAGGMCFAFLLVGGLQIGSVARKLPGTGVNSLKNRS